MERNVEYFYFEDSNKDDEFGLDLTTYGDDCDEFDLEAHFNGEVVTHNWGTFKIGSPQHLELTSTLGKLWQKSMQIYIDFEKTRYKKDE